MRRRRSWHVSQRGAIDELKTSLKIFVYIVMSAVLLKAGLAVRAAPRPAALAREMARQLRAAAVRQVLLILARPAAAAVPYAAR